MHAVFYCSQGWGVFLKLLWDLMLMSMVEDKQWSNVEGKAKVRQNWSRKPPRAIAVLWTGSC